MTNWDAIVNSTREVIETTCDGLLNTPLVMTENLITVDDLAASVFNGSYFVSLNGIPTIEVMLNSQFNVTHEVAINICYELPSANSVECYNNAINDIGVIVRERAKSASWVNETYQYNIQTVNFASVKQAQPVVKGKSFIVIPVIFNFICISNY